MRVKDFKFAHSNSRNMNVSILKERKIFLVDAIGGLVSAVSLLVPYLFEDFFGMPQSAVIVFISIAVAYSIYSTTVYLTNTPNWKFYLAIIALLNIGYCMFTVYHLFKNLDTITIYGYVYFITEVLIILTLSFFELKLSRTTANR
jgi:hypothetical protein